MMTIKRKIVLGWAIATMSFGVQPGASAGVLNDVPSCYAAQKLSAPRAPSREVFVVLDQTMVLDESLKASVLENLRGFAEPGNSFTVGVFSSFAQGRYLQVVKSGVFEPEMSEDQRNATGTKQLASLDGCLKKQKAYASKMLVHAVLDGLNGGTNAQAKSDIISGLKEFSSRVKSSSAQRKVILLVSDMLENSGLMSFYSKTGVRKIDAARELTLVEKEDLFADFGHAEIYVIGAGLVQEKSIGTYRDPKTMASLHSFWNQYFTKSNGHLIEFGSPALVRGIQ